MYSIAKKNMSRCQGKAFQQPLLFPINCRHCSDFLCNLKEVCREGLQQSFPPPHVTYFIWPSQQMSWILFLPVVSLLHSLAQRKRHAGSALRCLGKRPLKMINALWSCSFGLNMAMPSHFHCLNMDCFIFLLFNKRLLEVETCMFALRNMITWLPQKVLHVLLHTSLHAC